MADSTTCYPWFHNLFDAVLTRPQQVIRSGCSVGGDGNVNCAPEAMRANAEAQLRAAGVLDSLSLEAYTLARYMQGEVGNGTVEERVAVGQAAVNRAKMEGIDVNGLLLFRQREGHPNRGKYGPIHGVGTGVSTAPYGRWATTSADPTLATLVLADFIASGKSGNFAGADDQDGPEHWANQGQAALTGYVRGLAQRGKYWVGPIAGIDHWKTFLQFTPGIQAGTPDGQALMQRGIEALTLPVRRPAWPADLPVCGKPTSGAMFGLLGAIGFLVGAWWFGRKHGTAAQ